MSPHPEPIYVPPASSIANSQISAFIDHCARHTGRDFDSYQEFEHFAIESSDTFWSLFLGWSGLVHEGNHIPAIVGTSCETAEFFPNLHLSYAESLLASPNVETDASPAVISVRADGPRQEVSRGELRERVCRTAAGLRELGLAPGDRVVAIARNDIEAVVACLAVAAVGATFSSAAPDMGVPAVLSRFGQLQPKLLLAHTASLQHPQLSQRVAEVARSLESLAAVVVLDDGPLEIAPAVPVHRLAELEHAARRVADEFHWPRFQFNHPLFILFSSGTTGRPKCIVHGAGGTLLEHIKEHRLHSDLRRTDRLFFQTSCAWMMWNWQLSALACGAAIVLYDGPVLEPDRLWRIAADERVTLFGTNPAYLKLCEDRGYVPRDTLDLSALRGMFSTGSILYPSQFDWVARAVKTLPLQSISGGTDIIGCFVLGNPNLPVWRGESQCRSLALDVRSLFRNGDAREGFGELVCCNPFPSRPLGFWGDADGSRFHAAYFALNPGIWTHGDFVEISARGTARIHGRSDGVLNINGIRIGPAEIYGILQHIPEIRESMVVEQALAGGRDGSRMVLLLALQAGVELTAELLVRIRKQLGRRGSPAHVPAVILEVSELPTTHSGKRSERAATDALNGRSVSNRDALRNPESLDAIVNRLALHGRAPTQADANDTSTIAALRAIWAELFDLPTVGDDDDFFELGGDSLTALTLVTAVHERFGRDMPISIVFRARTIGALAMVLDRGDAEDFSPLVLLRPGDGRPVFIAHGMPGTLVELQDLARRLRTSRPVYGLQARGLDPQQQPDNDVNSMADAYCAQVQSIQPRGPYALIGYSFGGLVAYEIARRLIAAGEQVELLALLDTQIHPRNLPWKEWVRFRCLRMAQYRQAIRGMPATQAARYFWQEARGKLDGVMLTLGLSQRRRVRTRYDTITLPPQLERVRNACEIAYNRYHPVPLDTTVTLYLATVFDPRFCSPLVFWSRLASRLDVIGIATDHLGMIVKPAVEELAGQLGHMLEGGGLLSRATLTENRLTPVTESSCVAVA